MLVPTGAESVVLTGLVMALLYFSGSSVTQGSQNPMTVQLPTGLGLIRWSTRVQISEVDLLIAEDNRTHWAKVPQNTCI